MKNKKDDKTLYCERCEKFVKYKTIGKEETYNIMKKENITINSQIAICEECEEELFHEKLEKENQKKAFDKFRKRNNLLFPKEIKNIREKYNLTQKEMSKLLGWGEITYHRYEKGSLPDSAHNTQIMLIKKPSNVFQILESGNHELDMKTEKELRNRVEKLMKRENITITFPADFYKKLELEADNYGMELKEYVRYLLTKYHYEDKIRYLREEKLSKEKEILKKLEEITQRKTDLWQKKTHQYDESNFHSLNDFKYVK